MKSKLALVVVLLSATNALADNGYDFTCRGKATEAGQPVALVIQGSVSGTNTVIPPVSVTVDQELVSEYQSPSHYVSADVIQLEAHKDGYAGGDLELNWFGAGDTKNFLSVSAKIQDVKKHYETKVLTCVTEGRQE